MDDKDPATVSTPHLCTVIIERTNNVLCRLIFALSVVPPRHLVLAFTTIERRTAEVIRTSGGERATRTTPAWSRRAFDVSNTQSIDSFMVFSLTLVSRDLGLVARPELSFFPFLEHSQTFFFVARR